MCIPIPCSCDKQCKKLPPKSKDREVVVQEETLKTDMADYICMMSGDGH